MKTNIQTSLAGTLAGNRLLQTGDFVPVAAETAQRFSLEQLSDPSSLEKLYSTRRAMTDTINAALPLETEMKSKLAWRIERLTTEIDRRVYAAEIELPTIDPSFLSWKTTNGYPAFSIFTLESDETRIIFRPDNLARPGRKTQFESGFTKVVSKNCVAQMSPQIPENMANHYLDDAFCASLLTKCQYERLTRIELTAKYSGVMPESVREKIHAHLDPRSLLPKFDRILIVAEAPDESWGIVKIPEKDPLVIGLKHGFLWLIDAYDLTPVEQFARELCAKAKKGHSHN